MYRSGPSSAASKFGVLARRRATSFRVVALVVLISLWLHTLQDPLVDLWETALNFDWMSRPYRSITIDVRGSLIDVPAVSVVADVSF